MKRTVYLLPLLLAASSLSAFEFAKNGQPCCLIVAGKDANRLETLALEELKSHLEKMTGASFRVIPETQAGKEPAIFLGKTDFAASNGVDFSKLDREEWVIRTVGKNLILAGGRPAGTFFAVRALLEKAGCWSLAMDQEIVPHKPDLTLAGIDERKKPVIDGRNIYDGLPWLFNVTGVPEKYYKDYWMNRLRNRLNGGHGMSNNVPNAIYRGVLFNLSDRMMNYHTFGYYVDASLYKSHPEYFAMDKKGKRVCPKELWKGMAAQGGLCLSHPDVKKITLESLRGYIKADREKGTPEDWPVVYDISALDNFPHVCQCPACQAIVKEEGGETGLLLRYINSVAREIEKEYPGIVIRTFAAYSGAYDPPRRTLPAKNVIMQYCDSFSDSDGYRSLKSKQNEAMLKLLEDWAKKAKLVVWDYSNIGGVYFTPPRIETVLDSFQDNVRTFRDNGVVGLFFESGIDSVIPQNFYELNFFVLSHLLLDPEQDVEKLVDTFMDGYYGGAASALKQYLKTIREGVKACPEPQLTNRVARWPHVTPDFLTDSYVRLKEAEKSTPPDSLYRKRLHKEMLPLLYLLLTNASDYRDRFSRAGIREDVLLAELKDWSLEYIRRCEPRDITRPMKEREDRLRVLTTRIPRPEKFKDLSPQDVRLAGYPSFRSFPHLNSSVADDPESITGKALKSAHKDPSYHGVNAMIKATDTITVGATRFTVENVSLILKSVPQDEKYHWYRLPKPVELTSRSYFWGHSWAIQVILSHLYVPADGLEKNNLWDVWFSAKFTGPAWVKDSKQENAIWVDMVVLTRPGK
ncbi:MAG: hypothetical protein BWY31_02966 [Lentisphaerae bacterium ADurb.Bin242]|nr:MAG: hypothetical protein BWY31_02966 [Lentisphaerae bacterium ADurb.Bin242]